MMTLEKMKSVLAGIDAHKEKKRKFLKLKSDKKYYAKNRKEILRKQNERYRRKCGLIQP